MTTANGEEETPLGGGADKRRSQGGPSSQLASIRVFCALCVLSCTCILPVYSAQTANYPYSVPACLSRCQARSDRQPRGPSENRQIGRMGIGRERTGKRQNHSRFRVRVVHGGVGVGALQAAVERTMQRALERAIERVGLTAGPAAWRRTATGAAASVRRIIIAMDVAQLSRSSRRCPVPAPFRGDRLWQKLPQAVALAVHCRVSGSKWVLRV